MTSQRDKFGMTWIVGPGSEVSAEETGPDPGSPPMLVLAGPPCVVMVRPTDQAAEWPECVRVLRQLRDSADELAALLEARGKARRDGDQV